MRDFLPSEVQARSEIVQRIRSVYGSYGYTEIETPALEDLRFLQSGQGGENEKLIFKTLRRGIDLQSVSSESELADNGLRFDLTVPLARYFATNEAKLPTPFRALQIGPVWRAERPQRGRYRQFVQCDIDMIGEPGLLAEAELVSATTAALGALGFSDFRVQLNDRRLLHRLLTVAGFPEGSYGDVLITLDKIDKVGPSGVADLLTEHGFEPSSVKSLMGIIEATRGSTDGGAIMQALQISDQPEVMSNLDIVRRSATQSSVDVRAEIDLTLVRGMGYYTGPIFEIQVEGMGSSVAGGGRYDEMIGRFLGRSVPACGFSIGFERIWEILKERPAPPRTRVALLFEPGQAELTRVLSVAQGLRQDYDVVEVVTAKRSKSSRSRLAKAGFTHELWVDADGAPRPLHA